MNIICFIRYLYINDKHIIYIVPKFYKSPKHFKLHLYKEKNSLAQTVKMIMPVFLGDYNITQNEFKNICNENIFYFENNMFTKKFDSFDPISINSFINEIIDFISILIQSKLISKVDYDTSFINTNPNDIFITLS